MRKNNKWMFFFIAGLKDIFFIVSSPTMEVKRSGRHTQPPRESEEMRAATTLSLTLDIKKRNSSGIFFYLLHGMLVV